MTKEGNETAVVGHGRCRYFNFWNFEALARSFSYSKKIKD
jgi:hypothetical protein